MKTIAVVSTQMQLVNCVEYLVTSQNIDNTLLIITKSKRRKEQILEVLEKQCYNNFFQKIKILSFRGNRSVDFFLFFIYYHYIKIFCCLNKFNTCILGNYKDFLGRYLYANLSLSKLIVVDDGLASLNIAEGRINENGNSNIPFVFYPNRFIQLKYRNKSELIPEKLTFFTIFNLCVTGLDDTIHNSYSYLKHVSDRMDIPIELRQADVILLGQPLYHNILSCETYSWYLHQFAKETSGSLIYYPHPEEKYDKWKTLQCEAYYKYVENKFSIEILLSSLKKTVKVVSFFSSAITNVRLVNQSLIPESIYLNEIDYVDNLSYIKLSYNKFEEDGIHIIKYENTRQVK